MMLSLASHCGAVLKVFPSSVSVLCSRIRSKSIWNDSLQSAYRYLDVNVAYLYTKLEASAQGPLSNVMRVSLE